MPRTTTLECPSCPPLRARTFDALGLIKVVEARDKELGAPQVVERWGDPEPSKFAMAVSMIDRNSHPLLAIARKNNLQAPWAWNTRIDTYFKENGFKQCPYEHVLYTKKSGGKEQTQTEILVSEEVEASPRKRKKSSRNKLDDSERKKRSKQSKEHESEEKDGHEKNASRDERSKSTSKKRNKGSTPAL